MTKALSQRPIKLAMAVLVPGKSKTTMGKGLSRKGIRYIHE
jgi:hypothetical protein